MTFPEPSPHAGDGPSDAGRRRLLESLLAAVPLAASPAVAARLWAEARATPDRWPRAAHATLAAVGDTMLPSALAPDRRRAVVAAFVEWVKGYRGRADLGHEYAGARLALPGTHVQPRAPAAAFAEAPPSIGDRYRADLTALDRRGARPFADLAPSDRAELLRLVIDEARIDRLPARPGHAHIAVDLLAFWCASSEATDLCYEARIGRDACRGLDGSENRPERL